MLLYNVTYGIDREIEVEWLQWMKDQFVPAAMQSGLFIDWKIYKVINDEDSSVSYSVQYFANNIEDVVKFVELVEPPLNKEFIKRYRDRHVAFRTLLESV